jgi:hypothetical protein
MVSPIEGTIRKPSAGAMALALLMLLFGPLMFSFGYYGLSESRSERAGLIACSAAWSLAGPAAFGAALWLFGSLGRNPLALRIGGTAMVACGTVLATAAALGVLPCSTPG